MTLKEYMEKERMTLEYIAEHLDVTRQAVWYWANDKKHPKKKTIKAIHDFTDGNVSYADWF